MYSSKASIISSDGSLALDFDGDQVKSNSLTVALQLTKSHIVVLQEMPSNSQQFKDAIEQNGLSGVAGSTRINLGTREGTLAIDVTVTSTSPDAAKKIANIFIQCAPDYIASFNLGNAKPLAEARNASQVAPNTASSVLAAMFVGAAAVVGILLLVEMADKTIKNAEAFREKYDIPVLGCVPDFQVINKGGRK
jgi:capsular polysaccharide biosynthesis protein